jgi:hypothetical protein
MTTDGNAQQTQLEFAASDLALQPGYACTQARPTPSGSWVHEKGKTYMAKA